VIFPEIPPILPKKLPQKGSFWQKGLTFWGYGTSLLHRFSNILAYIFNAKSVKLAENTKKNTKTFANFVFSRFLH